MRACAAYFFSRGDGVSGGEAGWGQYHRGAKHAGEAPC